MRSKMALSSTKPSAKAAGSTMTSDTSGFHPRPSLTDAQKNAPSTARSPWARFTSRITPKVSESPVASSAYSPPSRMPCTRAFM